MSFKNCFLEQLKSHASMQYQDAMKLCYQAAFGAEHLLFDEDAAREYLEEEFARTESCDCPLVEYVCDDLCRVNIGAWKRMGLPIDELFDAFKRSATLREEPEKTFLLCADEAEQVMKEEMADFSSEKWRALIDYYVKNGLCPVRHSEEYRNAERPAYRIVKTAYLKEEWL